MSGQEKNILVANNLSKRIGERVLFQEISFGLAEGDKAGLLGRNGTGKSTLMKILLEQETGSTGEVVFRNNLHIAYVPQEPEFPLEATLLDVLINSNLPEAVTLRKYHEVNLGLRPETELPALVDAMDQLGAWSIEAEMAATLDRLGLPDTGQQVGKLSGGQKRRLALARALVFEPDFLLLDEPTNHLDIQMIEWLEERLMKLKGSLLMVTHDRYFLDNVCNRILELTPAKIYSYPGNYSYYTEARAQRLEQAKAEQARADNLYRRELEWMRRMPKARGTKSKSRIEQFGELEQTARKQFREQQVELSFEWERLGTKILELHKVSLERGGNTLLEKFTYTFKRGDRIGLVGKNGVGKTSFLKMITGELPPASGKVVIGETVKFGYYKQEGPEYPPGKRLSEVVSDRAEVIRNAQGKTMSVSQYLETFGFPKKQHYTPVAKLSGGEKRRLQLLLTFLDKPNFLILDEPTNDLDIPTLQTLEAFLAHYGGVLLIVSHDRFLLDKLTEHLFVFEGRGQIKDFNGSYQRYRAEKQQELVAGSGPKSPQKLVSSEPTQKKPTKSADTRKQKLSYNEQREFEQLDKEIPKLEARKEALSDKLQNPDLPYEEIEKLAAELDELVQTIDEKTERWLTLAEYA